MAIMAVPPFKETFGRFTQPRNPRIDWSNPITRKLSFAWCGTNHYHDLVTGDYGTPGDGKSRYDVGSAAGLGLNDGYLDFPARGRGAGELTIIFVGIVQTSVYEGVMAIYDNTDTGNDGITLCRNSAVDSRCSFTWMEGARVTEQSDIPAGFFVGGIATCYAICRVNNGSNQFSRGYRDGVFFADGVNDIAADAYAANTFRIAYNKTGGGRLNNLASLFFWDRVLSHAELASATRDPYQLLIRE